MVKLVVVFKVVSLACIVKSILMSLLVSLIHNLVVSKVIYTVSLLWLFIAFSISVPLVPFTL